MLQHPFGSITRRTRFLSRVVAWIGNGVQLHRPVTQRVVYTKTILHRADFTHLNSKLCADQLCKKTSFTMTFFLHRFPLTQGNFYTRDPLHRAAFARNIFLQPEALLHTGPFTQTRLCTEQFLHKDSLTQSSFFTEKRSHTHMFDTETFYTCPKLQESAVKIASMLSSWAGPKIYMLDCKNARNNCIYIVFVAKSA